MSALSRAVTKVMKEVRRLKKDDKNAHGKYDFTSVDDYKDFIRPLMAENGLFIHVSQSSFNIVEYEDGKGRKAVAQIDFDITLCHEDGERDNPEKATVALPLTGAQTSGAAKSYAIKEWSKGRFLLSSGDQQDEADLLEQSREGLRLSKAEARELQKALTQEMDEVIKGADHMALGDWWQENKYRTETLPKDWFIMFRTEYATAYKRLKAEYDLDRMTDAELDEKTLETESA